MMTDSSGAHVRFHGSVEEICEDTATEDDTVAIAKAVEEARLRNLKCIENPKEPTEKIAAAKGTWLRDFIDEVHETKATALAPFHLPDSRQYHAAMNASHRHQLGNNAGDLLSGSLEITKPATRTMPAALESRLRRMMSKTAATATAMDVAMDEDCTQAAVSQKLQVLRDIDEKRMTAAQHSMGRRHGEAAACRSLMLDMIGPSRNGRQLHGMDKKIKAAVVIQRAFRSWLAERKKTQNAKPKSKYLQGSNWRQLCALKAPKPKAVKQELSRQPAAEPSVADPKHGKQQAEELKRHMPIEDHKVRGQEPPPKTQPQKLPDPMRNQTQAPKSVRSVPVPYSSPRQERQPAVPLVTTTEAQRKSKSQAAVAKHPQASQGPAPKPADVPVAVPEELVHANKGHRDQQQHAARRMAAASANKTKGEGRQRAAGQGKQHPAQQDAPHKQHREVHPAVQEPQQQGEALMPSLPLLKASEDSTAAIAPWSPPSSCSSLHDLQLPLQPHNSQDGDACTTDGEGDMSEEQPMEQGVAPQAGSAVIEEQKLPARVPGTRQRRHSEPAPPPLKHRSHAAAAPLPTRPHPSYSAFAHAMHAAAPMQDRAAKLQGMLRHAEWVSGPAAISQGPSMVVTSLCLPELPHPHSQPHQLPQKQQSQQQASSGSPPHDMAYSSLPVPCYAGQAWWTEPSRESGWWTDLACKSQAVSSLSLSSSPRVFPPSPEPAASQNSALQSRSDLKSKHPGQLTLPKVSRTSWASCCSPTSPSAATGPTSVSAVHVLPGPRSSTTCIPGASAGLRRGLVLTPDPRASLSCQNSSPQGKAAGLAGFPASPCAAPLSPQRREWNLGGWLSPFSPGSCGKEAVRLQALDETDARSPKNQPANHQRIQHAISEELQHGGPALAASTWPGWRRSAEQICGWESPGGDPEDCCWSYEALDQLRSLASPALPHQPPSTSAQSHGLVSPGLQEGGPSQGAAHGKHQAPAMPMAGQVGGSRLECTAVDSTAPRKRGAAGHTSRGQGDVESSGNSSNHGGASRSSQRNLRQECSYHKVWQRLDLSDEA